MPVYLLTDRPGHYKIGRTKNLNRRIKQLKTANPAIKLVRYIDIGQDAKIERNLHQQYRHYRTDGSEWFTLPKQALQHLEGTLDRLSHQATSRTVGKIGSTPFNLAALNAVGHTTSK